MTYVPQVHENSKFIKQGEQEQVQSAGGYHLISNQENVERKKKKKDNQLYSMALPCRISKYRIQIWHKGVRCLPVEYVHSFVLDFLLQHRWYV